MTFPFCKGLAFRLPFFDGAGLAAERRQVKAAQSAPRRGCLDLLTRKARLHQIKNGGVLGPLTEGGVNMLPCPSHGTDYIYGNNLCLKT